jgi:hypothetical protein
VAISLTTNPTSTVTLRRKATVLPAADLIVAVVVAAEVDVRVVAVVVEGVLAAEAVAAEDAVVVPAVVAEAEADRDTKLLNR